jgi:hypothetical protein
MRSPSHGRLRTLAWGGRNRRARRRAATVVVLAITFVVGAATAAQASIGGFNGSDGTEMGGNCTSTLDWSCLNAAQLVTTPASGLAFAGSGSTENNPDSWVIAPGSVLTTKAAINTSWSYSFTNPTFTNNYFAFAFERGSGTGDSDVDFELNQNPNKYANSQGTSVVCRTNGDILVAFDVQSGASNGSVNFYKWTWTSGTPCTKGASGSFSKLSPTGIAEGALNTSPITNVLSTDSLGKTFPTGTFGETAVDLTALGNAVAPAGGCEFFNHVQLTTRTSQSFGSSMQYFSDQGNVFARLCNTSGGGGGGGGCTSSPTVSITSPADNSAADGDTVTLSGTSDQPEIEIADGTHDVGQANVTSGSWSKTLNDQTNGDHTYTAVATNACGTKTATVQVTLTGSGTGGGNSSGGSGGGSGSNGGGGGVGGSGGGSGSGSGSGFGSGTGTVSGATVTAGALACTRNTFAIVDVYATGHNTHLTGFTPIGTVGQRVKIVGVWNHKVLATVRIKADDSFTAAVKLPPAKLIGGKRGAYIAQLGARSTAPLRYSRRLYNTKILIKTRKITFTGLVTGPLPEKRQKVVIRGADNCAGLVKGTILARAKLSRTGKFKVTFTLPNSFHHNIIFLRAQAVVLKSGARGKRASSSRPKETTVFGIPRGVRV